MRRKQYFIPNLVRKIMNDSLRISVLSINDNTKNENTKCVSKYIY